MIKRYLIPSITWSCLIIPISDRNHSESLYLYMRCQFSNPTSSSWRPPAAKFKGVRDFFKDHPMPLQKGAYLLLRLFRRRKSPRWGIIALWASWSGCTRGRYQCRNGSHSWSSVFFEFVMLSTLCSVTSATFKFLLFELQKDCQSPTTSTTTVVWPSWSDDLADC